MAQVWLALKNKSLNFYFGILSVTLYIWLFFTSGLYAESVLNVYYLVVSIAGIFLWRTKSALPIQKTTGKDWQKATFIFVMSWVLMAWVLQQFTQSTVPIADAFVSASAWAGTWLMIHRRLENWIILNISNLIAIPLQWYKGMELTALLTVIYFIIALRGYWRWRKLSIESTTLQ